MGADVLKIGADDNVAIVLSEGGAIPRGHKVAVVDLPAGAPVVKYGFVIGITTAAVKAGEHVHTHNVRVPVDAELKTGSAHGGSVPAASLAALPKTFQGFRRSAGRAGTRNYLLVLSSVNCSATVSKAVAARFTPERLAAKGIDRVVPITHTMGCAQTIGGAGYSVLNRTLAGTLFHPNVVGAVIIGLGCEQTTSQSILAARQGPSVRELPLSSFTIQDAGGTAAAIERGVKEVEALLDALPTFRREALPVSELCLGMNCGGSDAFSGLTANPILGAMSDMLAALGGTSVLAEIPECHGTESLLRERCKRPVDRATLDAIFGWWERHLKAHDSEYNANLALGNIKGGITTIVEKSLGAVAKGGLSPIAEVVDYAQPITQPGLVIMNTPGFDPVSVTGLVAGGCNLVAFTTGRGSTFGASTAPTLKLATTSELFLRMKDDMDFDAGTLARGEPLAVAAQRLFVQLVALASGERSKSEALGIGLEEFVPWSVGETL